MHRPVQPLASGDPCCPGPREPGARPHGLHKHNHLLWQSALQELDLKSMQILFQLAFGATGRLSGLLLVSF